MSFRLPLRMLRVFLASSNDLVLRRDVVELSLRRMNDELLDRNVAFTVVRWEEQSMALHDPRAQDRYNNELERCDGLVALFSTRVGSYTKEELQLAYHRFRRGQLPRKILVCFEEVKLGLRDMDRGVREVLDLRDQLEGDGQVFAYFKSDSDLRKIIEREGRYWADELASTLSQFLITEEMLEEEVQQMPQTLEAERQVLRETDVEALSRRLGLFAREARNGHLAFEEGDVSYFARLEVPRSRLEAKLRARKLVLQQADKLNILIWRQGQVSAHAKYVEALLIDRWLTRIESI